MAKLTGPLLSFGAKGQLGKTVVFDDWKGIKYARQYSIPANPNTTAQQLTRGIFTMLQSLWLNSPTLFRAPWTANAVGRAYTNRNKLVAENLGPMRGETDMNNFIASPGALGGPPLDSLTPTTGSSSGEVDAVAVAPAAPVGWTLASVTFVAFPDQDPEDAWLGPMVATSDASDPYDVVLSGLPAATVCQVAAFPVWTRPDGETAYGASLIGQATSGA